MDHRNWSRINRAGSGKCAVEREEVRSLRARVASIERGAAYGDGVGRGEKGILPLGLAEIDQTLPAGGSRAARCTRYRAVPLAVLLPGLPDVLCAMSAGLCCGV